MLLSAPAIDPAVTPILLVGGIVVLGVILTLTIRSRNAARQADALPPHERIQRVHAEHRQRDDIDGAAADALEHVQRLASQLDVKAERLEQLLQHADETIARLTAAAGEAGRSTPLRPVSDAPVPVSPGHLASSVYALADSGHAPLDIARRLNEQMGKVELVLALRDRA